MEMTPYKTASTPAAIASPSHMVGSVISEPPLNLTTLENSDQQQQSIRNSSSSGRDVLSIGSWRPGAEKNGAAL
jgi:hypothetical protein